jgi:hypothetical protein
MSKCQKTKDARLWAEIHALMATLIISLSKCIIINTAIYRDSVLQLSNNGQKIDQSDKYEQIEKLLGEGFAIAEKISDSLDNIECG